ncbi:MAG TPA: IclR family transcriptional regulator [Solirubrobacteraceae bacterium]|nr:IclR family transcriptional regulator [Solirubrobacteraceae bacterium]
MLGTVGKASRVLDLFTNASPEWGVTEAALALGVPRSSAHDLLDTLACTGLVRRVEGNRYRLGLKLLSLSDTALTSLPVRSAARPVMDALARKLGAAVHLATLEQTEVLYIDKATPASGPRSALSGTGRRLPLHCTAVGKVLLAHQPTGTIARTLEQLEMVPITERSVCSVDALRFELAGARRAGVARDREGSVRGICCHAAPIIEAGQVTAGISVSVPVDAEQRLGDRYDEIVAAAAARITRALATTAAAEARVAV